MNYTEFLQRKVLETQDVGIEISKEKINKKLFEFQSDIVQWSLKKGKAAIFADCGLGKTPMQLEWSQKVYENTKGNVLILAPLAVAPQTIREGAKFDIAINYCREQSQVKPGITVANYEMLHKFDCESFSGVVLDESSILKNFTGKIKTQIIESFKNTPYKLACTATPAPNDYMEIGNHSEFLNIMPSNEMLSRWFINDTMHMGGYRLKNHAVKDFWRWVASWAVAMSNPNQCGYKCEGYNLPELSMHEIQVKVNQIDGRNDGELFRTVELNATNIHSEMRRNAPEKADIAANMVHLNNHSWVIWCNTNYEADALVKLIPDAVEVRGSDSITEKERKLNAFSSGEARIIITKPSIAGYGLNWQHCHNVIFVGLSYSFELFYQAIRRTWRFGQKEKVNCYLITADTEFGVKQAVQYKMNAFEEMKRHMYENSNQFTLNKRKELRMDYQLKKESGKDWTIYNGDCVEVVKQIPDNSVHMSIFSPPFSNLYIYSDSYRDMGNCADDNEFLQHFSYLVDELYRITLPGRICAVHCKNLVKYKGTHGRAGMRDFRGAIIRLFEQKNWQFHSETTIWIDPVLEMQKTKAHGLLYKQLRKDSSFSRNGMAEYLVMFRKWPENEDAEIIPVTHTREDFPLDDWQELASPIWRTDGTIAADGIQDCWFDVKRTNVLNCKQARAGSDEKHICPLQLDIIERAVRLWSNPGEMVFSPFSGIGSEGYQSVKMKRKFTGIELKKEYFDFSLNHLKQAELEASQVDLFDAVNA